MLENLVTKFRDAEGRSEFVIVVVCDIRNFSGFSSNRQAPEIAIFISKFYEKLLTEYFRDAVFAKPTGDGLIMTFRHKSSEADLLKVAESVLMQCSKAAADYPAMLTKDLMINFPLPERIGFGVARGTAFCLFAGDEIIDYSGQILNLASRLNDFAKPSGVVIDGAFLMNVIPKKLQENFREENVFIRGIAEDMPHKVYCSKEVVISDAAKHPINSHSWIKEERIVTYKQIKTVAGSYSVSLPVEPVSADRCKVKMSWPSLLNPGHTSSIEIVNFKLEKDAEGSRVQFDMPEERKRLMKQKLKNESNITISIHFVPKPTKSTPTVK
ncbi:MAG: hypothetical protein PHQ60_08525 [Sideroxydans sp.]|nr:hypothetical protein [Sideroxydans sp.]